jgi:hypothetical protein
VKRQRRRQSGRTEKMNTLTVQFGGSETIYMLGGIDMPTCESRVDGQAMKKSVIDSGKQSVFTIPKKVDSQCN